MILQSDALIGADISTAPAIDQDVLDFFQEDGHGWQDRITAAVALPGQRPMLILAPDRETAINNAYDWFDLQLAPDKTSE